jgi:DNA ligase (NAD+)
MAKIKTEKEYLKIVKEVIEHDKRYYIECKPVISDYEYDLLMKKLADFEKENPNLIHPNSPTQRVGEGLIKGFKRGKHIKPMLSLSNTYSEKEIDDFIKRVLKSLKAKEVLFCMELKMDGTAVSIRYENGKLVRALTRGNGKIGDDITNNIKTIKTLPLKLKSKKAPSVLEVRGEVFIHKKTFQNLNRERENRGLDVFANPRNAAAGSLKLLNSKEVVKRRLDIVCYGIAQIEEKLSSQFEVHGYLKELGLPTSLEKHFSKARNLKEILKFADGVDAERKKLSFEIDGIVIKVDDLKLHEKLGATGKSPRFAAAYKFAPEQAYTKINDITIQVGRTGVLTPVAELEPVFLAGSKISRATLHNQDEIKRKDIRVGDFVVIEKGGDVIPKVVSVDLKKRKKGISSFKMPKKCPICDKEVIQKKGEVALRCINAKCLGRRLRHLSFFASKKAMDIDNLGYKIIEKLVDLGLVTSPSDLYALKKEDLEGIEGFKEKSINNLLDSINNSRDCSFSRFIMGLEIQYVGSETADLLANNFKNLELLKKAKREDFIAIEGIGDKVADSVFEFFKDEENLKEIKRLLAHGVKPKGEKVLKKVSKNFDGKVFVLTGALEKYTRDEAYSLIKERGGKTSSSVSKNTDFVLVGSEPGSKYKKAKELNIKTITEKEFEKML